MTDHAGTLTYFAMMSLFPALLLGVTLLGLFGQQGLVTRATKYLLDHGADADTASVVSKALDKVVNSSGGALGLSLRDLDLPGAQRRVGRVRGVGPGAERRLRRSGGPRPRAPQAHRPRDGAGRDRAARRRPRRGLHRRLDRGQPVQQDRAGQHRADGVVDRALAGGPVRRERGLRARLRRSRRTSSRAGSGGSRRARCSPSSCGSCCRSAFGVYIQNFSTYGAAYGAFGAAIVLLLWLYLSANAFLFGGEFNAELERAERIGDGAPPAAEPATVGPRSRRDGAGGQRARRAAGGQRVIAQGVARPRRRVTHARRGRIATRGAGTIATRAAGHWAAAHHPGRGPRRPGNRRRARAGHGPGSRRRRDVLTYTGVG